MKRIEERNHKNDIKNVQNLGSRPSFEKKNKKSEKRIEAENILKSKLLTKEKHKKDT